MIRQWCDGRVPPRHDPRRRFALCIGTDRYSEDVGPLSNSVRDAQLMTQSLQALGFSTYLLCNCPIVQLRQAIATFAKRLRSGDVVTLFYSGHAIDHDGVPQLLARDSDSADPMKNAINLNSLVLQCSNQNNHPTDGPPGYMLVLLDACRRAAFDSPTAPAPGLGIFKFQQPCGVGYTLALSSDLGSVAPPTPHSRNSLFTARVLEAIQDEHMCATPVDELMREVSDRVNAVTGGEQIPYVQHYARKGKNGTEFGKESNLQLGATPSISIHCSSDWLFEDGTVVKDGQYGRLQQEVLLGDAFGVTPVYTSPRH